MKSFRELEVYQKSKELAIRIHKMTLLLPKFEMYEEASQIRRSSKAVTSAIVEGYGRRRYKAEFIRYLIFSQTECDETIVHLEFLHQTESLNDQGLYNELYAEYEALSKRINKFIQWVEEHFNEDKT